MVDEPEGNGVETCRSGDLQGHNGSVISVERSNVVSVFFSIEAELSFPDKGEGVSEPSDSEGEFVLQL